MQGEPEVAVLRLGHRPGRDERMTTHVGLTARALGADRAVLAGDAGKSRETVEDITDRFGGPFAVELTDSPKAVLRDWEGKVVHLTMYGERVQDVEDAVRAAHRGESPAGEDVDEGSEGQPILVVVGSQKVSFDVYEAADWNVGVTNQPHSEVAGLAVFLDRLFEGRELDREWTDADRRVVPEATGKTVIPTDEE
ncbi:MULTISPECIES: tRNA (cytidine(56)-2'-O)-methyltransferase [Halorussus]|uniref:tRNA (cytidine(56)-2'-O)-methyltransferase n=1 Tax=Halorussus TaxID=1070314 RepID=UPI000E20D2BD|nr:MULTISPECIES: tRNA (cytidine(56)-2'-O)-methyltransferase [Halorussus]NHN58868.1 tRNA (cytidine(56)-2'-O)-methyltransferase [Halorussus sp. JP-T4]